MRLLPQRKRKTPISKRAPERSRRLRVLVFSAQVIAFAAVASVTHLWIQTLISIGVLGIGSYYADRFHAAGHQVRGVRIGAFVGLHLALVYLMWGIFAGIPYPQAQFAMIATAIVTFELYNRLNLFSAIGMGMVNLYVAATLSRDVTYALFLIDFVALWLAFLWRADSEDGTKRSTAIITSAKHAKRTREISGFAPRLMQFAALGFVSAGVIFVFTPRFIGRPLFMPISIQLPIRAQPSSEIINPALPLLNIQGTTTAQNSEYYYGFANQLTLSYRGGLSDTIMMYVSSPAWSYWRGYAYDTYDGVNWSQSSDDLRRLVSRRRGSFTLLAGYTGETFVQSFYIAQDMPNILWTGGTPIEAYFPAEELAIDETDGVRVGEPVRAGTVYSIVSAIIPHDPDVLRAAVFDDKVIDVDLQLPGSVTQRTRDLAEEITADAETVYDKVIAVRDYLLENYPYDYFPPPQPPDTDAVDQFLFVDKRGVCEHFVSAMVVLLRSINIQARFAVGYGSGDYNAFTNFYEVRANDAHAWVEVYFPGYAYVAFDPTPGWTGEPQTGSIARSVFSDLFPSLDLSSLPIGQMAQTGMTVIGKALPLFIVGAAGIIAVGVIIWVLRRMPRRELRAYGLSDPRRKAIFRLYRQILRQSKTPLMRWETIHEHAARHSAANALLTEIAPIVDRAAYDPTPISEQDIQRTRSLIKGHRRTSDADDSSNVGTQGV